VSKEQPVRERDKGVSLLQDEPQDRTVPGDPERGPRLHRSELGRAAGVALAVRLGATKDDRRREVAGAGQQQLSGCRVQDADQGGDEQLATKAGDTGIRGALAIELDAQPVYLLTSGPAQAPTPTSSAPHTYRAS